MYRTTLRSIGSITMLTLLSAFMAIGFQSCGDDEGGGGEVDLENGNFKGTTWGKVDSSYTSITEWVITTTVSFTSNKEGVFESSTWGRIKQGSKWGTPTTQTTTWEFTYVYSKELGTGVYTSKKTGTSNTFSFKDENTMTFGAGTYKRK
jgi:hypothetical protein